MVFTNIWAEHSKLLLGHDYNETGAETPPYFREAQYPSSCVATLLLGG